MPTFNAQALVVQVKLNTSQNKARRVTREYLRLAADPTMHGLLDHAALTLGKPPKDPTGEAATWKADGPLAALLDTLTTRTTN